MSRSWSARTCVTRSCSERTSGMRSVSHSQSGKFVGCLQNGEKQFLNHLLKVLNHKISTETSQFMFNLYLKLSLTSFKNKFQQ